MKKLATLGALLFTLGLLICVPVAAQTDGSCTDCVYFDTWYSFCGSSDGPWINCANRCDDDGIACSCKSQVTAGSCFSGGDGNHHFVPRYQVLLITPDLPFSPRYTVVAVRVSRADGQNRTADNIHRFVRGRRALPILGKSRA